MAFPRRTIGILATILVAAVLAAGIYFRISGSEESDDDAPGDDAELPDVSAAASFSTSVAIPVEGRAAVRDTLVLSVTAAGQAAGAGRAVVTAQVDGRVRDVPVRESQYVTADQLLVAIESEEFELELERAEAELESARAQYRDLVLFNDRIEDPDVRAERERAARARSGLTTAEIALRQARMNLDRTQVRAPFAGRVATLEVVPGEWVGAADELMTIVDIDPIKVQVQVLEGAVGYLEPGHSATIEFAAIPETVFTGRIETINPVVDESSRTAMVTVLVDNPDGRILPGMYARVSLEAQRFPDRMLVPREAILERGVDRRTMLFVFEEGEAGAGLAKWRYVTTGLQNDSLIEIVPNPDTEMVESGEMVLINGHYTLTHDARVRIVESVAEAGGRPQ